MTPNSSRKLITRIICLAALLLIVRQSLASGGVMLGATRIIYPASATQASISLTNKSDKEIYLVQSWVTDSNQKKSADFIVTPPLFVSHPGKENTLRIERVNTAGWPQDRESLYYFNAKSVPSAAPDSTAQNTLQFATQSVIKMFIRPKGLPVPPVKVPDMITCSYAGKDISITNASPYYASMVDMKAGSEKIVATMVAPKSTQVVHVTRESTAGKLQFQTINDYGALSAVHICQ